jgi:lipopolysaccharide/colanic/teichoic acid biosynthesis glycosyltransferase
MRRNEYQSRPPETGPPEGEFPSVRPRHRWYLPIKAVVEWIIALGMLIVAAPILGVLAGLVRLTSPGPAFHSQARAGRNGRIFQMYKLRSMRDQCEAQTGPIWARRNDSRITPIGRVLRQTHLDELPQLIHVLRGQMSLIGPRPERPELCALIEQQIPQFRQRLQLRPGLTGLAQSRLPADVAIHSVRRKLTHDLYYIREVGPWLDLRIALSTALLLLGMALHIVGRRLVHRYGTAAEYDTETGQLIAEGQPQEELEAPAACADQAPLHR